MYEKYVRQFGIPNTYHTIFYWWKHTIWRGNKEDTEETWVQIYWDKDWIYWDLDNYWTAVGSES